MDFVRILSSASSIWELSDFGMGARMIFAVVPFFFWKKSSLSFSVEEWGGGVDLNYDLSNLILYVSESTFSRGNQKAKSPSKFLLKWF